MKWSVTLDFIVESFKYYLASFIQFTLWQQSHECACVFFNFQRCKRTYISNGVILSSTNKCTASWIEFFVFVELKSELPKMENANQAIRKQTQTKYEVTSCYFCSEFLDNIDFKVGKSYTPTNLFCPIFEWNVIYGLIVV